MLITQKTKLFIWQSSIEQHEYYTWAALQDLLQTPIVLVLGYRENELRKKQGWEKVDLSRFNVIDISAEGFLRLGIEILNENREAIHIFLGFRGTHPKFNYFPLIIKAIQSNIRVAILNEPYSTSPVSYSNVSKDFTDYFRSWTRPYLYKFMAFVINKSVKVYRPCIFPISHIAKDQFIRAGFYPKDLFPFGYFIPRLSSKGKKKSSKAFQLVFLGVAIPRKGLDILIEAISVLRRNGYNITLDLYGQCSTIDIGKESSGVVHKGLLPFEQVQSTIRKYDLLVLPSRHDGWGVVVNEALMQRVPVIVSDAVGSKCLVQSGHAGLIFKNEDSNNLAENIKLMIENHALYSELCDNAKRVGEEISPRNAANYFLEALEYHFFDGNSHPYAIWS